MRLSKNFTLEELTRSNTALRMGIDNTPSKEHILKLRLLTTQFLQVLRDRIGALRVTSGYRSPELCEAIGSNKFSQHAKAEAVDLQYFKRGRMDNLKIFNGIIEGSLEFDQIILEYGGASKDRDSDYPDWLHVSWKIKDNRRQILVAYKDENNKTKYRPPINYHSV
jgi:zinc D-Ala-D-Ala carboxypeptidase